MTEECQAFKFVKQQTCTRYFDCTQNRPELVSAEDNEMSVYLVGKAKVFLSVARFLSKPV